MSLPPFSMVPTIAWGDDRLLESDLRVLGALCSHWNSDDGFCYPSHRTLAGESGRSLPTVKRALIRLRELGYVDWTGNARSNGGRSVNSYYIVDLPGSDWAPLAHLERPMPSSPKETQGGVTKETHPPAHDDDPSLDHPRVSDKQTNQQTKGTNQLTTAQRPQKTAVIARVSELHKGSIEERKAKAKAKLDEEIAKSHAS
jgi:Helix-turn-helix domain